MNISHNKDKCEQKPPVAKRSRVKRSVVPTALLMLFACLFLMVGSLAAISSQDFSAQSSPGFGESAVTEAVSSVSGGLDDRPEIKGSQRGATENQLEANEKQSGTNGNWSALKGSQPEANGKQLEANGKQPEANGNREVVADDGIPLEHEAATVLVRLTEDAPVDDIRATLLSQQCVANVTMTTDDLSAGFVEVSLVEDISVPEAIGALDELPHVEGAQPNYVYRLADTDDALTDHADTKGALTVYEGANGDLTVYAGAERASLGDATGMRVDTQETSLNDPSASAQWALDSIQAREAWDIARGDGSLGDEQPVTVAVLDNGCLIAHEDLKDRIVAPWNSCPGSSVHDIAPIDSHGTHVAGIVAAQANNGVGVAGVSYNAQIMPIKIFEKDAKGDSSASSQSIVRAYEHIKDKAEDYNIRVVNLSVGLTMEKSTSTDEVALDAQDELLITSVQQAYEDGILTVCSAGNDANKASTGGTAYLNYPSDWLDCALAVIALKNTAGADGSKPSKADYSNYNMIGQRTKDLSAPGSSIYSTVSGSTSSYGYNNGTSMAAPCVAGVAALVFAANPSLTAEQAASLLCNTATDLGDAGWDVKYGAGEVNALRAVQSAVAGLVLSGADELLKGGQIQLNSSIDEGLAWESSNEDVATVNDQGLVTGVGGGVATISVRCGAARASKEITVYDISFSGSSSVTFGEVARLQFNETPDTGMWRIASENSESAGVSVTAEGIDIWGLGVGEGIISATLDSDKSLVVSYPVSVTPRTLVDEELTWDLVEDAEATLGKRPEPLSAALPLWVSENAVYKLVQDKDYTVVCSEDIDPETLDGTVTITLTGVGNFTGTLTKEYEIKSGLFPSEDGYGQITDNTGGNNAGDDNADEDNSGDGDTGNDNTGNDDADGDTGNDNTGNDNASDDDNTGDQTPGGDASGENANDATSGTKIQPVSDDISQMDKHKTSTRLKTNTLRVKTKRSTIKVAAGKTVKVPPKKVWKVLRNASKGKLTYVKIKGSKKIRISKKGRIIVKKGLKRGVHTLRVKVFSAATKTYKAAATKNIRLRIKVV